MLVLSSPLLGDGRGVPFDSDGGAGGGRGNALAAVSDPLVVGLAGQLTGLGWPATAGSLASASRRSAVGRVEGGIARVLR